MEMEPLLTTIFVMGVMIAIGALIGKRMPLTHDSRQLMITLIVNVGLPCIILHGLFQLPMTRELLLQIFIVFGLAFLLSCLGVFLGFCAARLQGVSMKKACEMAVVSGFGNTGTIGLPLCAALFGPKGAVLAAVFDAGMDLCLWTLGVMLLQEKRRVTLAGLKSLVNIPMMAIVLGLLLASLGLTPPPAPIKQLTATLAAIASPMAMIYIGMLLFDYLRQKRPLAISRMGAPLGIKLAVYPIAAALLITIFPLSREIVQVVAVQVAMPTIAIAPIVFARYGADEELAAMMTVFSTLLSLVTIPLVMMVNHMFL
ncbi:AEC family transporter [Brevibacillus fluminis]|uniref:AEC family transporter n=1 Tax=Brevibacillus fluminis TaxID=511487 RepID=A0A3M8DGX8_9BACL|nr:AEC family transporter [Brevibacillus fluminis]RNB87352.1 AEC family transporter [Brevibacillus fluminis]